MINDLITTNNYSLRSTLPSHVATRPPSPPLESEASEVASCRSCPRRAQPCSRRALTSARPSGRMATPPRVTPADLETLRGRSGRPVCLPGHVSLPVVFLPVRVDPRYRCAVGGLRGAPFEPLQSVELKFLSLKTVLLSALATVKRVGDLQAFSVDDSCLEFGPADSHIVLRPRPGYVPKVSTMPFRGQVVNLQALPREEADPAIALLCPFVPCASMWTARRASGPQTSSLSASEDSRREELSPNKDSPTG